MRGSKDVSSDIDSAFYFFKLCADSLNRDTSLRTFRRNSKEFSDYEIYYKADYDRSSSKANTIFAPLAQKEKLNTIVLIFYLFYYHDYVNAEKYYNYFGESNFYIPEYMKEHFKNILDKSK